jgi:hypothetical protein
VLSPELVQNPPQFHRVGRVAFLLCLIDAVGNHARNPPLALLAAKQMIPQFGGGG